MIQHYIFHADYSIASTDGFEMFLKKNIFSDSKFNIVDSKMCSFVSTKNKKDGLFKIIRNNFTPNTISPVGVFTYEFINDKVFLSLKIKTSFFIIYGSISVAVFVTILNSLFMSSFREVLIFSFFSSIIINGLTYLDYKFQYKEFINEFDRALMRSDLLFDKKIIYKNRFW